MANLVALSWIVIIIIIIIIIIMIIIIMILIAINNNNNNDNNNCSSEYLFLAKRNKIIAFISHSFKTRESKTITLQFQIIGGRKS